MFLAAVSASLPPLHPQTGCPELRRSIDLKWTWKAEVRRTNWPTRMRLCSELGALVYGNLWWNDVMNMRYFFGVRVLKMEMLFLLRKLQQRAWLYYAVYEMEATLFSRAFLNRESMMDQSDSVGGSRVHSVAFLPVCRSCVWFRCWWGRYSVFRIFTLDVCELCRSFVCRLVVVVGATHLDNVFVVRCSNPIWQTAAR